jgi:hypothetical protein
MLQMISGSFLAGDGTATRLIQLPPAKAARREVRQFAKCDCHKIVREM